MLITRNYFPEDKIQEAIDSLLEDSSRSVFTHKKIKLKIKKELADNDFVLFHRVRNKNTYYFCFM